MKDIIVNWVKEDEELLEPYEWDEDDDLEIISRVDIYHVDEKTCMILFMAVSIFMIVNILITSLLLVMGNIV